MVGVLEYRCPTIAETRGIIFLHEMSFVRESKSDCCSGSRQLTHLDFSGESFSPYRAAGCGAFFLELGIKN